MPLALNQQKKICIYLGDCGIGGSQRTIINLANTLNEMHFSLDLLVGDDKGPAKKWLNDGISYKPLGITRQMYALPKLVKYFWRTEPDVVLSSMAHENIIVLLAAFIARVKGRVYVRETNPPAYVFTGRPFLKYLARLMYPRAAKTIALSTKTAKSLAIELNMPAHCIRVIHNPVDVEAYDETSTEPEVKHDFILAAGRLTYQKNFSLLLHSYAIANLTTELWIVGDGPLKAELQALTVSLHLGSKVKFLPQTENLQPLIKAAKFFVLSSSWEGFGHVVVEAMAASTAVLATNCDGPADIITNGKDGLIVPRNDAYAMARKMRHLDSDEEARLALASNARRRANCFDRAVITRQYLTMFFGDS